MSFPNVYIIETWSQFDRAVEAGWPAEYIKERLPVMLDYDNVVRQYKERKGIPLNASIGPADPPGMEPVREGVMIRSKAIGPSDPTPPSPPRTNTPYQNGYRPIPTNFGAKEFKKAVDAAKCRCDIKDLLSSGHVKGCPEKKK